MQSLRTLIGCAGFCALAFTSPAFGQAFINEFHYDNVGTDVDERVEVIAPAGTSFAGYQVILYNGSGGAAYATYNLSGTAANQCNGWGTVTVNVPGIQNGNPDGIVLVNGSGQVIDRISYGGTFNAVGGAAAGQNLPNIGVSENSSTPTGQSLQRTGSGSAASAFSWVAPRTASWGACNSGQSFTSGGGTTPPAGGTLTNGVTVSNLSIAASGELRYTMAVPSGATNLKIETFNGTGDADLYVRFGTAPTTSTYDCRPYLNGNTESCTFAAPQVGTYHVLVRAYTAVSGMSLRGSFTTGGGTVDNPPTVTSTTPASGATNVSASANISVNFSEAVTLASGWFTLSCTSGSRSATVSGSGSSYTLDPSTDFASADQCTFTVIASKVTDTDGTPTAMTSDRVVSFTAATSAPPAGNTLTNGVTVSNLSIAASGELRYTMAVPTGATNLKIETFNGTGDADLYVRFGTAPTTSTYDCRPYLNGNTESCTFATPQVGTYHVLVRAYTAVSGLSLRGSFTTGGGTVDNPPTVTSTTPASGASNVDRAANISVVFSEAVTLGSGWYTLSCTSGSRTGTVSGSGTTYTLNPSTDFGVLDQCTFTVIASQVIDTDGTPTAMASNRVISFTTVGAQSGYYGSVNTSTATMLRATLHPVIDDHTKIPYTSTATDTWDVLALADEDPLNPANVLEIYKNQTYVKHFGTNATQYNREHTWPKSLGFPTDGSTNLPYTDTHMLMLSDSNYNSVRNNNPYGACNGGGTAYATVTYNGRGGASQPNRLCSGIFETWVGRRGDVARAIFYMDLRYEGGTHSVTGVAEPDLRLTDNVGLIQSYSSNQSVAYMGLLSVLIQWHQEDPVDDRERLRNEIVYSYQGNRNPFIDNPQWVGCIYQNVCN